MRDHLAQLEQSLLAGISAIDSGAALETFETERLGRKGEFATLLKQLGTLSPDERKEMGRLANEAKARVDAALAAKRGELESARLAALAEQERLDVTLPPVLPERGSLHPVSKAIMDIGEIFSRIGFVRVEYPEVEWDHYAFEALNMPKDHPARDDWETFFVDAPVDAKWGKLLLTPHTSNGQVREMEKGGLPIRMINISKCYRRQSDVTHAPMFHQCEGLMVDKGVSVTHLKGTVEYFMKAYFGADRSVRLRPYHFRFTEPSFEIDVSCGLCGGTGLRDGAKCRVCKAGWLELGGAGMVHPNVLKAGGIDPEVYGGFAFGWGVERVMMMRAGVEVDDIRELYQNDLRFLTQWA
jgi:phenylalanyl-tRNA synthetase alpha chain